MTTTDISITDYHTDNEYTSHSRLRDLHARGPRYYYDKHIARTVPPSKPSAAFVVGQALEDLVQRPDTWSDTYVVRPDDMDGRTVAGKAWAAQNAHKLVVSAADGLALNAMAERVSNLLDDLRPEWRTWQQQVTYRAELRGVKVQARPDWVAADGTVYDLKTCEDLDDLLSGKSIANYGYHTQGLIVHACASGELVTPRNSTWLVCVEKQLPNRSALVQLDDSWWSPAMRWASDMLLTLRTCQETNAWPLVLKREVTVYPPAWL